MVISLILSLSNDSFSIQKRSLNANKYKDTVGSNLKNG